MSENKEEI